MKTKGLTIQEAIQSGLPFKRPLDLYFTNFDDDKINHQKAFSKADLLATDWEIKVPEVTITREKLAEAWQSYPNGATTVSIGAEYSPLFNHICAKLGI